MDISLDLDFLDGARKDMMSKGNKDLEYDKESKDWNSHGIIENIKDEMVDFEITDTKIEVTVANDMGCFSFEIPLTNDVLECIVVATIKKMNKIKSLIESLK
jgi:hypothetical protein